MDFELVVAYDNNRGIGLGGDLPWNLPRERQHFQGLTMSTESDGLVNAVMMGRTTWESLVRRRVAPLKKRKNVVVTKTPINHHAIDSVGTIDEGLKLLLRTTAIPKVFGIGGAQFYKMALEDPRVSRIHATEIAKAFDCDTFFPEAEGFEVVRTGHYQREKGVRFRYVTYQRKQ